MIPIAAAGRVSGQTASVAAPVSSLGLDGLKVNVRRNAVDQGTVASGSNAMCYLP